MDRKVTKPKSEWVEGRGSDRPQDERGERFRAIANGGTSVKVGQIVTDVPKRHVHHFYVKKHFDLQFLALKFLVGRFGADRSVYTFAYFSSASLCTTCSTQFTTWHARISASDLGKLTI